LLRVLEDRSFYRVGGVKKREFAARIICAGNRNMMEMVEKGLFRRDLFHRLRVGHLLIPPLRQRIEDIRPLAEHFLRREAKRKKKRFSGISPAALEALRQYPWPGNVREMENTLERAVLMHDGDLLLPEHIQFLLPGGPGGPGFAERRRVPRAGAQHAAAPAPLDLKNPAGISLPEEPLQLDALMDAVVAAALKRFGGNKSKTADYLGISRFALHRRLQQKKEDK
jgi:DNA-binding NtrC family response regulator